MKKITLTFYSPKELWCKFWNRAFWPRRKECSEWMENVKVELAEKIVNDIVIGKYYNICYISEEAANALDKDITNAIYDICEKYKKVICKPL